MEAHVIIQKERPSFLNYDLPTGNPTSGSLWETTYSSHEHMHKTVEDFDMKIILHAFKLICSGT
jgi:hypothetical protein